MQENIHFEGLNGLRRAFSKYPNSLMMNNLKSIFIRSKTCFLNFVIAKRQNHR